MIANAEVLAAEEALERATQAVSDRRAALEALERATQSAAEELARATSAMHEAGKLLARSRQQTDSLLPCAVSVQPSWCVGEPDRRDRVVVVHRTAKTIFTRYPGREDHQRWRKDSHGVWRKWPHSSRAWLEIAE